MCNPFFQLITNSMMYGGGYMTGSGMETTAMLFSGVNSVFNCCCGYDGYGNYGYDNSYNQNTKFGWMAGIIGFNVAGMLANKGIQNHKDNVAIKQAQQAQNAKNVETALKVLGLTESEAISKGQPGIASLTIKDEYNDQSLKNAKATKTSIETEIKTCDTNIKDLDTQMKNIKTAYYSSTSGHAALVKQLNDLKSLPADNQDATKISKIEADIKQLEDNMAKCKPGGGLYDSRKEFKDAKTQHESDLNDANTLIETITQKQQEFKEAKETVTNNLKYLIDKQTKANKEQEKAFKNTIDDVDGNWFTRWGASNARSLIKNGYKNGTEIKDFTDADWQKLLSRYKKSNSPEEKSQIRDFLVAKQDDINNKYKDGIPEDIRLLLNSIINGG